jgi:cell division protein FtsW
MFRTVGEKSNVRSGSRTDRRRYPSVLIGDVRQPAAVSSQKTGAKAASSRGSRVAQLKIDVPLLLVVITLLIFGLIMVFSASYDYSAYHYEGKANAIFIRQVIWLILGIGVALFLAFLDYHYWGRFALWAMLGTIVLLLGVLIVNEIINGASRTLYRGSIQPSELAKIVIIIYLSVWLYSKRAQLHQISFGLLPLAAILGFMGGLILVQPDLSATVTIFVLGGLLFFLAGGDLRQIAILMVVTLIVGFAVVQVSATGSQRIADYLAGLKDPTESSYHVRRAYESFVKGGWMGVGLGRAETKLTGLPVPPTDSIFAVVGEETGVLGALALVGLYLIFLWRGLTISRRAPDQMGALLAAGLTLWIAWEAFVNMAVMVNLLPFAGNALPLISAGGSNMLVTMASIGILMNISRLSEKRKEADGKLFNAVVNLRGRNRRRGVSGAGRASSAAGRDTGRTQS